MCRIITTVVKVQQAKPRHFTTEYSTGLTNQKFPNKTILSLQIFTDESHWPPISKDKSRNHFGFPTFLPPPEKHCLSIPACSKS